MASALISVLEAICHFDIVKPVAPRWIALSEAVGLRTSEDVMIRRSLPEMDVAAIDGWATSASKLSGACRSKALSLPEGSKRVDRGTPIPGEYDCVIDCQHIIQKGQHPWALKSAAAGEGIIKKASLCAEGDIFLDAGSRITVNAAINGTACGIGKVIVRRPVVDIISNSRGITAANDRLMPLMGAAIRAFRASVGSLSFTAGNADELANLIQASSADVIATVGGIGVGPSDTTLDGLKKVCDVKFHGVRLNPGKNLAFGMIGEKPVYSLPANQMEIMAINSVLTSAFARKVFGRDPKPIANRQAKLLDPLPGGKCETSIYFGLAKEGKIQIMGSSDMRPAEMAAANAIVVVMEGDRHRRVGEAIFYLPL